MIKSWINMTSNDHKSNILTLKGKIFHDNSIDYIKPQQEEKNESIEEDGYTKRRKWKPPISSFHSKAAFFWVLGRAWLPDGVEWSVSKVSNPNVETSLNTQFLGRQRLLSTQLKWHKAWLQIHVAFAPLVHDPAKVTPSTTWSMSNLIFYFPIHEFQSYSSLFNVSCSIIWQN